MDKIQKRPVLRDIVMLGYGTLVAKYCIQNASCSAELVLVCITLTRDVSLKLNFHVNNVIFGFFFTPYCSFCSH